MKLAAAFLDAFQNQKKYGIGCYTASKLVMTHGILDYYSRVSPNPKILAEIEKRLWRDGDPIVDVEPGIMWSFEEGFPPEDAKIPGKVLTIQYGVAPKNFVPGDWTYFYNTDRWSHAVTGYEGSNSIYLGRDKFDDFYNDNNHSFTYDEKLDEVFQWGNGVFTRPRDNELIQIIKPEELQQLGQPPQRGGYLQDFRVYPDTF